MLIFSSVIKKSIYCQDLWVICICLNKTKTKVKRLTEDETINEIARIASGEVTEVTRIHAKELRKTSVA